MSLFSLASGFCVAALVFAAVCAVVGFPERVANQRIVHCYSHNFSSRSVGRRREHFATFYIGNDISSPGAPHADSGNDARRDGKKKIIRLRSKERRRRARRRERHIKEYDVPLAYLLFEL